MEEDVDDDVELDVEEDEPPVELEVEEPPVDVEPPLDELEEVDEITQPPLDPPPQKPPPPPKKPGPPKPPPGKPPIGTTAPPATGGSNGASGADATETTPGVQLVVLLTTRIGTRRMGFTAAWRTGPFLWITRGPAGCSA